MFSVISTVLVFEGAPVCVREYAALQVHAINEVIGLLCGEGQSFLPPVTSNTQPAAHHQQEQSANNHPDNQSQDRTYTHTHTHH